MERYPAKPTTFITIRILANRGDFATIVRGVQQKAYEEIDAAIAQLVERIHGKDEVLGSNPSRGSRIRIYFNGFTPSHNLFFMIRLFRLFQ